MRPRRDGYFQKMITEMNRKCIEFPPLAHLIDRAFSRPEAEAKHFLVTSRGALTYRDLWNRMCCLNELFQRLGLRPGDRVAVASDDDHATITIILALIRAGLTVVLGDGRASANEFLALLEASDPAAVFADSAIIEAAPVRIPVPAERIVCVGTTEDRPSSRSSGPVTVDEVFATGRSQSAFPDFDEDTLAFILFTSGTTSHPKGVMLTHANMRAQLEIFARVYGFDEESRLLNILPLHHVDGLVRGPLAALCCGGTLHRPMRFSVPRLGELLETIPAAGVTHFVTVPAILGLINRLAEPEKPVFRNALFRFVICSADFLEPGLWKDFQTRFGVKVVNAYGLSEVVCDALFCGPDEETSRVGTLGKPVGCHARVVDDQGRDVETGTVGELLLSGPTVMQGYFRQHQETAEVLRDGWFRTGDIVSRDHDGFYHFAGRKKAVIISGGVTIHPENVTSVLLKLPGVVEALTIGVEDPIWRERVAACLVLETGCEIEPAEVIRHCRDWLAPEKVPSEVHFLSGLPRGATGKVLVEDVRRRITGSGSEVWSSKDLFAVAADCFRVPVETLSPGSTPYNTEGWDSLAHLSFISRLEERFEIALSAMEVIELSSMADACTILERRTAQKGNPPQSSENIAEEQG